MAGSLSPLELKAWQDAVAQDRLHIRTSLMVRVDFLQHSSGAAGELAALGLSQGLHTGFGDHRLRIGPAKMFADGSLIGRTAYMFEPFATDPGNTGFLVVPEEVFPNAVAWASSMIQGAMTLGPMIGGMISSAVHVLIMTPVIFVLMKKRDLKKGRLKYSGMKH